MCEPAFQERRVICSPISRRLLLALLAVVLALPISLKAYYLVETSALVFILVFAGLSLIRMEIADVNFHLEFAHRVAWKRYPTRRIRRATITCQSEAWGSPDMRPQDAHVTETILDGNGRPIFNRVERFLFSSRRLAEGVRYFIRL